MALEQVYTSPANGSTISEPGNLVVDIPASDNDGSIARVELSNNGSLFDTDFLAPYSFNLAGLAAGSYTLEARAYDELGAVDQATVRVSVTSANGLETLPWSLR